MNGLDSLFNFHQTALRLREQRQELLASNIANSDTPNYKAQDFDFASTLKKAVGEVVSPSTIGAVALGTVAAPLGLAKVPTMIANALVSSASKHIPLDSTAADAGEKPDLQYRVDMQGNLYGNTVNGDVERNLFTDNALHYESSLTSLRGKIKDMMSVLQG